jgi:hypothetical protein
MNVGGRFGSYVLELIMFKHHKILEFGLILVVLFAHAAHAETIMVDPGLC